MKCPKCGCPDYRRLKVCHSCGWEPDNLGERGEDDDVATRRPIGLIKRLVIGFLVAAPVWGFLYVFPTDGLTSVEWGIGAAAGIFVMIILPKQIPDFTDREALEAERKAERAREKAEKEASWQEGKYYKFRKKD
jgi:hypothetical protein